MEFESQILLQLRSLVVDCHWITEQFESLHCNKMRFLEEQELHRSLVEILNIELAVEILSCLWRFSLVEILSCGDALLWRFSLVKILNIEVAVGASGAKLAAQLKAADRACMSV